MHPECGTTGRGPGLGLGFGGVRGLFGAVAGVAVGPLQELVEEEDGVVDAGVQVAQLGEPGGDGGDGEVARVGVVDLVPPDRRRHHGLGHPAHRVGAADRVVAGVLVVVDEHRRRVAVLAPPRQVDQPVGTGGPPPGRTRARPGARRRNRGPARSGRRRASPCRPRSSASRWRPARRGPPARRAPPGGRPRRSPPAWGRGRCATRRAARCPRPASSTDGTRPWTSAPPTRRRRDASTHSSSACRPHRGKSTRTVRTQSGAPRGSRFWCTFSPVTPVGKRCSMHGRSRRARTMPSETAR